MGRDKRNALAVATASRSAKERHQRSARDKATWAAPVTRELVALPEKNIKSKHQSYFQVFENHDKKAKKLEFKVPTHHSCHPFGMDIPLIANRLQPIGTPLLDSNSCP